MAEMDLNAGEHASGSLDLPHESYRSNANSFVVAAADIWSGLTRVNLWASLAWEDFQARYHRAFFGFLWAILSFVLFCLAIIFFRMAVAGGTDRVYHVIVGFLVFRLLVDMIMNAINVFVGAGNWLQSVRLPYTTFIFRSIFFNLINFCFSAVGALSMLFFFDYNVPSNWWMAIPGLIFIVINAPWVYMLIGVISARFRDFGHLLGSILRMAVFFTPILWYVGDTTDARTYIALLNPLTHFIEIVREPLVEDQFPFLSWMIVLAMTVVGNLAAYLAFVFARPRIIVWI